MEALERAATLVSAAELRDYMNTWASFGKAEAVAHFQRLAETFEQRHGVSVDQELLDKYLAPVYKALDDWPRPVD